MDGGGRDEGSAAGVSHVWMVFKMLNKLVGAPPEIQQPQRHGTNNMQNYFWSRHIQPSTQLSTHSETVAGSTDTHLDCAADGAPRNFDPFIISWRVSVCSPF